MYTPLLLFGVALLGIMAHNLMKMDTINRKLEGKFNYWNYLSVEKFSIILSVIVAAAAAVAAEEVKELSYAGKYLALGFFAIGFMSQSILVKVMGKASKFLDDK